MPEKIRVRVNDTGDHITIPRAKFERNPEVYAELKQDATYPDGTDVPPKYKTTVSTEAAKKTGGQTAGSEKE